MSVPRRSDRMGAALVTLLGVLACSSDARQGRVVVATQWDTVLVIGTTDANDTTLVSPVHLSVWNDRIVVVEDYAQVVRAFSTRPPGAQLWVAGSTGEGPGEMVQGYHAFVSEDGVLCVEDGANVKILEFDSAGQFLREQYYRHLPPGTTGAVGIKGGVLWPNYFSTRPFLITSTERLDVIDSVSVPWPVPDEGDPNDLDLRARVRGYPGGWVAALMAAPFFAVMGPEGLALHRYVVDIPYAYRPGILPFLPPGVDTVRWAARDVSVVRDEVFLLFGGRPRRRWQAAEETRFVDVYGLDGRYRRSYHLPFHAFRMDTADGSTFFFLTQAAEMYPQLIGLRPVVQ